MDDEGEDDEDIMIDLDKLDEPNRQMLLEFLQKEYEKNPNQFPFPKEVIEQQLMRQFQQKQRQETESVRDIKSDEMVVEETSQQRNMGIQGGEQEIEEEDELTPEQQMQLQQILMHQ